MNLSFFLYSFCRHYKLENSLQGVSTLFDYWKWWFCCLSGNPIWVETSGIQCISLLVWVQGWMVQNLLQLILHVFQMSFCYSMSRLVWCFIIQFKFHGSLVRLFIFAPQHQTATLLLEGKLLDENRCEAQIDKCCIWYTYLYWGGYFGLDNGKLDTIMLPFKEWAISYSHI